MIRPITYESARVIYRGWHADKHGVSLSAKGDWFGYFADNMVVGIVSAQRMGKWTRVKTLFVNIRYRKRGIGAALIAHVASGNCTAFATPMSERLFARNGFQTITISRRNIAYMKKQQ